MGLRFRKSVRICKGVKINFSKSGASLSLGGRGHSVNLGRNGTRTTLGIPGTGISYSTKLSSAHYSKPSGRRSSSSGTNRVNVVSLPSQVQLKMSAEGKVALFDMNGIPITDQTLIRRIKATDIYKNGVRDLEIQRQIKMDEYFNNAKAENDKFVKIYQLSPQVDKKEQYVQMMNELHPQVYSRKQFDVPYPKVERVRELLKMEAANVVHGGIFKVGKLRREYVEANVQSRFNEAVSNWKRQKDKFETEESEKEMRETERYNEEYNANIQYMNNLINGEDEVICEAVESWISSCELPVEIKVDYEWYQKSNTMCLDVDLPEIEDLPENEVVRLASGNLKEKKKTQATLKQEYVNLVFGLAIFISANIYNVSPAIHNILISGYTQRRDKAGDLTDEYVYSIIFTREVFENSVIHNVDPMKFCMRFQNRSNVTSSMLMKRIEPYEVEY